MTWLGRRSGCSCLLVAEEAQQTRTRRGGRDEDLEVEAGGVEVGKEDREDVPVEAATRRRTTVSRPPNHVHKKTN